MADITNLSQFLEDVATAIREKRKVEYKIKPENFDIEILAISGGGSGGDTSDATANPDDVLSPKTFYGKDGKQVGTIEVEYMDSDFAFNNIERTISITLKDYRPDIGYAVSFENGITIYSVSKDGVMTSMANYSSGWPSGYSLDDAKFAPEPIYKDDEHCIYNLFIALHAYGNIWFRQGVYCLRFDTLTGDLYEGDTFSQSLAYTEQTASAGVGYYPGAYSTFVLPVSSANVLLLQNTPGRISNRGDTNTKPVLVKTTEKGYTVLNVAQRMSGNNGKADCTISGNIYCTYTSDNTIGIYGFNAAYTSYKTLYTGSRTTYSPVLLDDKYIVNDKLYDVNGNMVQEYENIFQGNSNYKFYIDGFIFEMVLNTGLVYRYSYNPTTFTIKYDGLMENRGATGITFGNTNLSTIPRHIQNGLVVYNGNVVKYYIYNSSSEGKQIVSLDRNGIKYVLLDGVSLSNSNDLMQGVTAYGSAGKITGTMKNNGQLIYDPSTEAQDIPLGYTSGGIINPVTSSIDENILPENIKQGVTILGVEGEITPGAGDATSDANLQARYLLEGYSMVEDGALIAGTMKNYATKIMPYTSEEQEIPTGYYDLLTVPVAVAPDLNGYEDCLNALIEVNDGPVKPYTELSYIKTTGTQFINTGIKCKSTLKFQVKFSAQKLSGGKFFGNQVSENDAFRFFATSSPSWYLDFGSGEGGNRINGGTPVLNTVYEFEVGNRYVKNLVTGTNVISSTAVSAFTKTYDFLIANTGEELTIYYCKIYDGDTLIGDFIPADDGKGVICMYDKVSKQCFYNNGSGEFIPGDEVLPYTELNYIQSSGRQYIDTGYIPKTLHTRYEIGFMRLSANGTYNPVMNNEEDVRFGILCTSDVTGTGMAFVGPQGQHKTAKFTVENNVLYNFVLDKTGLSVNDTKYELTDVGDATGSWGACINTRHSSASAFHEEYSIGRWYYVKIYEDGVLVKDLIPVIEVATNEVCMYDKKSKEFLYNIGTGNFISGGVKE